MKTKILLTVIFTVLCAVNAVAHEYWFEPETFFLQPKEKTVVHLYVGDGLVKNPEERAFQLDKAPLFGLFSANETEDLKTKLADGVTPVYNFAPQKAGNYLLAMERNWSYIKLEKAKFEDYLREDGMEYINSCSDPQW